MADKELFLDTLREVAEIVRVSGKPVEKEEVRRYFSDMDLSKEQEEMIYQYLKSVPEQDVDKEGEDVVLDASGTEMGGKVTASDVLKTGNDGENVVTDALETENSDEDRSNIAGCKTSSSSEQLLGSEYYQMYLNEVKEKDTCTEESMQELYLRLLAGENVTGQIADGWLMRVIRMAEQYEDSPVKVNMQDLIQEGNVALWVALQNIDEKRNPASVDRYLQESVQEAFEDYIRDAAGVSDQTQAMLSKAALLYEAQELLASENGHTPSMSELSAYTHISVDEIQSILALYAKDEK